MTQELVEQLKSGQKDAFKALYERYGRQVYGTAMRMLGVEADAADVVQEVFLAISQKIGKFKGDSALSTWIYRITVNATLDRRRKMNSTATLSIDELLTESGESSLDLPSGEPDAASRLAADHVRRDVRAAFATLNPKLAAVMTLRYSESLDYAQIAEVLGCSLGTVKSRIVRAHVKLMPILQRVYDKHFGDSKPGEKE